VNWRFVALILGKNSIRLSRTRGGTSDTSTSLEKQPLLLQGEALQRRTEENERRVQQFLFDSRRQLPPQDGKAVLDLLWTLADLTNDGLLDDPRKLRTWPSHPKPPAPQGTRVEPAALRAELDKFADEVYRRWPELDVDPVPLASWAEWELNGGRLHPFYDGCGRISRSFGALLLLRASWLLPLYEEDPETYFLHGHGGPKQFAAYVRRRVRACTSLLVDPPDRLKELPLTWKEIEEHLSGLPGFDPKFVKKHFKEDEPEKPAQHGKPAVPAKPGTYGMRLFFKVLYRRGEVIVAKDSYSDYAALHLQGLVRFSEDKPVPPGMSECWENPRPWQRTAVGRFFSRLLPWHSGERLLGRPSPFGAMPPGKPVPGTEISTWKGPPLPGVGSTSREMKDVADRLMGVTGALWHRKRSATLRADNDGDEPCVMLLIKRKALEEILAPKQGKQRMPGPLFLKKFEDYLKTTFPKVLRENRLFRSLIYVEDILNWETLLGVLTGKATDNPRAARIQELLDNRFRLWLATLEPNKLDDPAKYRITNELNKLLKRNDLYTPQAWAKDQLKEEEQELLAARAQSLTVNECSRCNRLLIEAAFPGETLRSIRAFRPNTDSDFADFAKRICEASKDANLSLEPERYQKADAAGEWADRPLVYDVGAPADGLFLILSGKFVVTRPNEDGALLNHLSADGFFGESCIEADGNTKRQARVEVLSNSGYLIKIDRNVVHKLAESYPLFIERLKNEVARSRRRDAGRQSGLRPIPQEPPQAAASRLVLTTNLLLIDMDRCTRCDQCVQACCDAHQDRPRFHRANPRNPDLRFGKWEVAAACLHCSDAPCLEECPVGAITFLESGAVQIHRDRCIGCNKCPDACPFHVIDMYPPAQNDPDDGRSLGKKLHVATKCDLCLTNERQPPCVVACPYGAAIRGRPEDFFPDIKGWASWADPE
jgi:Fe-S-cluster-containing dehydrogenase component